jgi:uncharacterized protein
MGIVLYKEPELERPDLIASWPGIGNIGVITVDTLKSQLGAEEMGEIEPWDFFYPSKVIIRNGILKELEFPTSKFYFKRTGKKDLIFFIGEEQPPGGSRGYAEGKKAYQLADLVLEVAAKFGCQRIYTSGAAVALNHHAMKPRVWSVASSPELIKEVKQDDNVVLMGEMEGRNELASITGLNGLLLGMAKQRGFEAVCLMGEIPDYLSSAPFPYPKASRSVLEVLTGLLGIQIDYTGMDEMTAQMETIITGLFEKLPPDIKERIEQRVQVQPKKPEAITEEDETWLKAHIDDLFKKGGQGGKRGS